MTLENNQETKIRTVTTRRYPGGPRITVQVGQVGEYNMLLGVIDGNGILEPARNVVPSKKASGTVGEQTEPSTGLEGIEASRTLYNRKYGRRS